MFAESWEKVMVEVFLNVALLLMIWCFFEVSLPDYLDLAWRMWALVVSKLELTQRTAFIADWTCWFHSKFSILELLRQFGYLVHGFLQTFLQYIAFQFIDVHFFHLGREDLIGWSQLKYLALQFIDIFCVERSVVLMSLADLKLFLEMKVLDF